MATQGRQIGEGRIERQGTGLCEKTRDESEAPSTRGRQQARLFLLQDDWDEEKADFRKDSQRPKQSD